MSQPFEVALSSDGVYVAANNRSQVLVWRLTDSTQPSAEFDNLLWPAHLVFVPSSHRLAISICNIVVDEGGVCSKQTTLLFDVDTHQQIASFPGGSRVAASPDGKYLAIGLGRMVMVWEINSGKITYFTPIQGIVADLAFSPDGSSLAIAEPDMVWIYTLGKDQPASAFVSAGGRITLTYQTIAFRSNSDTLYMGGCSPIDNLHCTGAGLVTGDIAIGHGRLHALPIPPNSLKDLAVDYRGKLLAGANDIGILFWDLDTSAFLGVLPVCSGPVSAIAFNPSQDILAAVCQDGARLYQYTLR